MFAILVASHWLLEAIGAGLVVLAQRHLCHHRWHQAVIWLVGSTIFTILSVALLNHADRQALTYIEHFGLEAIGGLLALASRKRLVGAPKLLIWIIASWLTSLVVVILIG